MFSQVLDCPKCKHRFEFDYEDEFPAEITCPGCGESMPYSDFCALAFCPECRTKLKIPLDILSDSDLACPKCGKPLRLGSGQWDPGPRTLSGMESTRFSVARRMLQDGDFFDKFMIISMLGRGGMAEVYLGEHLLLHQKCALKLMRGGLCEEDPVFAQRFVREARLAHSINHPNIVKVFDVGTDLKTGYLFLAMEYVEGRPLSDIIRERQMSEEELREILLSMANALSVLDSFHVVHRDIKPSNIMRRTEDGVYKLMDLGIAKAGGGTAGEVTLTLEQVAIGTPSYASPEQCQSSHDTDIRSDIYCLGATMYHLACGKVPFDGGTPVEIILKVMQDEPEPLGALRPDLSRPFTDLIRKMMKKDPAERPQTPGELIEYLSGQKVIEPEPAPKADGPQYAFVLKRLMRTAAGAGRSGKALFRLLLGIGLIGLIVVNLRYLNNNMSHEAWQGLISMVFDWVRTEPEVPPVQRRGRAAAMPGRQTAQSGVRQIHPPAAAPAVEAKPAPASQTVPAAKPPKTTPAVARAYVPQVSPSPPPPQSSAAENEGTIETRIEKAEKRLRELQTELSANPKLSVRTLLDRKIRLRTEQLRRLKVQLAVREHAKRLDRSRFDSARMEQLRQKFAEYTRKHTDWGYGRFDIDFSNWLISELKTGKIDPNIEVVDSTYARYSGPLIKCILSGRIHYDGKIAQVLVELGADTSPIHERPGMYGRESLDIVLTRGGYDDLTGCLLPYMRRHPIPEKTVTDILQLNHRVDEQDNLGNTALHYAARSGSTDLVSLLLLLDADVNALNHQGETPLFAATRSARQTVCDMLVKAGANQHLRNNDGKTIADMADVGRFQIAVNKGRVRDAGELLKKGVDPNTRFSDDFTALQTACRQKNFDMVKLLLENGADPNIKSQNSVRAFYPLQLAFDRRSRDARIFALLLKKGADPNIPPIGYGGTTFLRYMCEHTHFENDAALEGAILDALLADPRTNLQFPYWGGGGRRTISPLPLAFRCRKPIWFVRKLLAKISTFEQQDSVVADAVSCDYPDDLIKELIAKGANVNIPSTRVEYVRSSSDKGAVRKQEHTTTALFAAVEKKRLNAVRMLLEQGADPDWRSPEGKTVRDLNTSPQIRNLLNRHRAP